MENVDLSRISRKQILVLILMFIYLLNIGAYAEAQAEDVPIQTEEGMGIPSDILINAEEAELSFRLAELTFDPKPVTIDFDQSVTLAAMISNKESEPVWSSSDGSVATVSTNEDGSVTVTGVGEGKATISCSVGEQVRTFNVTVNPPKTLQILNVEYPSSLQISHEWTLGRGIITSVDDLQTLTSIIKMDNGEVIGESYTKVFEPGVKHFEVKGIDEYVSFSQIQTAGTYDWILTAIDVSGRTVTLHLPIHADASEDTLVSITSREVAPIINTSGDSSIASIIELWKGEKEKVTTTLMPGSGTDDLAWVSYNPTVATVSSDGEITGVGAGSTVIVCKSWDGSISSAGCTVIVHEGNEIASLKNGNYIPEIESMDRWVKFGPLNVIEDEEGDAALNWQANPVLEWNAVDTASIRYSELRGKEVTISLDVRSDDAALIDNTLKENGGGFLMDICVGSEPGVRKRWIFLEPISYPKLSTQWRRISTTLTLTDDVFTLVDDPSFTISDDSWVYLKLTNRSTGRMQVRHLKLEIGDEVTDWIPASADEEN